MAFFQRRRTSASQADPVQQARARHPSAGGGKGLAKEAAFRPTLGRKDWAGIEKLLAEGPGQAAELPGADVLALEKAIEALRSFVRDQRIVGATYVRDWLLDLWSAGQQMDPAVARPAELLLTRLVGRELVSADEIRQVCELTERAGPAARPFKVTAKPE